MRVLIWGNCYPRVGGVETFITNFARALGDRSIDFMVVSDGSEPLELSRPFPIRMMPMQAPLRTGEPHKILEVVAAVRGVIESYRPDFIHYHTSGAEILVFERAMRVISVPYMVTLHNVTLLRLKGTLDRVLGRAFATTAASAFIRDTAIQVLGERVAGIQLIRNAIPPMPEVDHYPFNQHILGLGRIMPEKGFDTLLEAFAMVRREQPAATLTIAGQGAELGALDDLAAKLGVRDAVSFPGWIEPADVHAAMLESAVIAFPSRWSEPFGLVALEAGQASRPCVATRVGELPAIIVDGETGYVVSPDRPDEMAAALSRLLTAPDAASAMGRRAKQRTTQLFSFDAMVDAYLSVYDQACAPRGLSSLS
jgi:glycosyltransferase involved in cell wall biosynthesis